MLGRDGGVPAYESGDELNLTVPATAAHAHFLLNILASPDCRCGRPFLSPCRPLWLPGGKPTDNAVIESFNGRLCDECLNQHWFLSLDEARAVIEAWRDDYNRVRLHSALGNRTPSEFARPVDGHARTTWQGRFGSGTLAKRASKEAG